MHTDSVPGPDPDPDIKDSADEVAEEDIVWTPVDPDAALVASAHSLIMSEKLSDAGTLEELKSDIMSLVSFRYSGMAPAGARLAELNRRFGIISKRRFGLSCREVIVQLVDEKRLSARKVRDSIIVWDKQAHDTRCSNVADFDSIAAIEDSIANQTVPAKDQSASKSYADRPKARFSWE